MQKELSYCLDCGNWLTGIVHTHVGCPAVVFTAVGPNAIDGVMLP